MTNNEHYNTKPTIYTSGAIEFSKDPNTWRDFMYKKLHKYYDVIIPDPRPCPLEKSDIDYGKWVRKHYIMPDMGYVASCNHFMVVIDDAYSSGTYGELSSAAWLGKDILCYLKGVKLEDLPTWIIGCLCNAKFVNSLDEAVEYYKNIIKEK